MSPLGFSAFGEFVTGEDVELAVRDHLEYWLPTYLGLVETRRFGPRDPGDAARADKNLAGVKSWERANDLRKWPESDLPAVIVVNQGTAGEPVNDGAGNLKVPWMVGVLCVVTAGTPDATKTLSQLYAAAARMVMTQHGGISGFAETTKWLAEGYDPLPSDLEGRAMGAAFVACKVTVPSVVNTRGGSMEPADDPLAGVPEPQTPTSRNVEVDKR